MELLTGGCQTTNGVVSFPDNLASFPLEINSTNKKLPSISFNGPNSTEFNPAGVLDGASFDGNRELQFLAHLACQDVPYQLVNAASVNGSPAVGQMITDVEDECRNIITQARIFEAHFSSSSDDDSKPSEAPEEPVTREKKMMKMKKLELFLQNTMHQVMQKQDQMHKQLIEMVEKREQERIIQEEAWTQQEIERAQRNDEEKAQETFRSLALISFIQNLLGQEVKIPNSSETSFPRKDHTSELHNKDDRKDESSNRRWPKTEVQALITVRMALDHKFLDAESSGLGWEVVAARLAVMGYNRTPFKCKEKWQNINKYYKRTKENGKQHRKSCPYFDELDILYKRNY